MIYKPYSVKLKMGALEIRVSVYVLGTHVASRSKDDETAGTH